MKHTEEVKKIISDKRKDYLKNNPDKHPWKRNSKFKSIPCEKVKEYLNSKNIKFVEEWQPLDEKFYSIDIAFPDIKFGIEINGNQHYNADGTLKEYYQKRHDEIVNSGWVLLELHYSISWNLDKLENLIDIKEQPDYDEYFKIKKEKDELRIKIVTLPRGQKALKNSEEKWKPFKELVKQSNINFNKFGWGVKLSKILNISPQQSAKWMKRHFPETYENVCFKVKRK